MSVTFELFLSKFTWIVFTIKSISLDNKMLTGLSLTCAAAAADSWFVGRNVAAGRDTPADTCQVLG